MNPPDLNSATWRQSSLCSTTNGGCVEVSEPLADGARGVRDSTDLTIAPLVFTKGAWDSFAAGMRSGDFRS